MYELTIFNTLTYIKNWWENNKQIMKIINSNTNSTKIIEKEPQPPTNSIKSYFRSQTHIQKLNPNWESNL